MSIKDLVLHFFSPEDGSWSSELPDPFSEEYPLRLDLSSCATCRVISSLIFLFFFERYQTKILEAPQSDKERVIKINRLEEPEIERAIFLVIHVEDGETTIDKYGPLKQV